MSVLALFGLMALQWMAVATVIFFAEKNWRYGIELSSGVGAVTTAAGCMVLLSLLPSLSAAGS
jgi:predicted metal-binding membrane protein